MQTNITSLSDFPKGEFHAFSIAKMASFLPYTKDTTIKQLKDFFGLDFDTTVRYMAEQLIIYEKKKPIVVPMNRIIVKFPNGSYKVIDVDYYKKNFNEPLVYDPKTGPNTEQRIKRIKSSQ